MMFFDALFLFIVKQTTHKRDIDIYFRDFFLYGIIEGALSLKVKNDLVSAAPYFAEKFVCHQIIYKSAQTEIKSFQSIW